jgi:hypothetical protein
LTRGPLVSAAISAQRLARARHSLGSPGMVRPCSFGRLICAPARRRSVGFPTRPKKVIATPRPRLRGTGARPSRMVKTGWLPPTRGRARALLLLTVQAAIRKDTRKMGACLSWCLPPPPGRAGEVGFRWEPRPAESSAGVPAASVLRCMHRDQPGSRHN